MDIINKWLSEQVSALRFWLLVEPTKSNTLNEYPEQHFGSPTARCIMPTHDDALNEFKYSQL